MAPRLTRWKLGATALALVAVSPFVAPEVLAFPHSAVVGEDRVWSEVPLPDDRIEAILSDANSRVAQSPLAEGKEGRRIFLTDGGWRWRLLSLQSRMAYGLTRPLREDIILNRSDVAKGVVYGGLGDGRTRQIAGVIAHEKCHGMMRRRLGILGENAKPVWLKEGYCDYVAQETTLSAEDVASMEARGESHPALPYYRGYQKVGRKLRANGGDVDALLGQQD